MNDLDDKSFKPVKSYRKRPDRQEYSLDIIGFRAESMDRRILYIVQSVHLAALAAAR